MVLQVLGEVHNPHAAGAEVPLDAVTAGERGIQSIGLEGHAVNLRVD